MNKERFNIGVLVVLIVLVIGSLASGQSEKSLGDLTGP